MIMNVYRKINKDLIQFDFICLNEDEGEYDEEIKQLGGRIYKILPPSKVGYLRHIKEIVNICKKSKCNAIHIPTQFHSGIVCLAAYIAKVPIRIVHSHSAGGIEQGITRKIYKFFCRRLINMFATDKIACGNKARDYLFGKSKKIKQETTILKNGIDTEIFKNIDKKEIYNFRKKIGVSEKTYLIGNVGRFCEIKNQIFFIKIAESFKQKEKNFKILLVGDGETRKEIEEKIKQRNLINYFILPGIRSDIPVIMNAIDVLVMPSLYEGFPMTVIEALASGKKCILSDTVSREVEIIDNSVDFVSLDDNIEKWIDSIENSKKYNGIKSEIQKKLIQKGYDVKTTTKILEKIYLRDKD